VEYLADLQSVHGFRCYDNIAQMRNVSECLYSLYAWFRITVKTNSFDTFNAFTLLFGRQEEHPTLKH